MRRYIWLNTLHKLGMGGSPRPSRGKWPSATGRRARFETLEDRRLLAAITVNSALDNTIAGDGLVTLRDAIVAANENISTDLGHTGAGADTIVFDPAVFSMPRTIALSFGELAIIESLSINGPGQTLLTVDAQIQSAIFNITATTGDFAIGGLTLTRGTAPGDGGAVRSLANLTVNGCTIIGNSATGNGGGISATNLTLIDSMVTGNSAPFFALGGGVYGENLTLANSTVSGNSGGSAGIRGRYITLTDSNSDGIHSRGGSVTLTDSSITGRGIYAEYANLTILRSDVSGEIDVEGGNYFGGHMNNAIITESALSGPIFTRYANVSLINSSITGSEMVVLGDNNQKSMVSLVNSTISGSPGRGISAGNCHIYLNNCLITDNLGGGIANGGVAGYGDVSVTLTNTTVSGNSGGGGLSVSYGRLTLLNSTVSGNSSRGSGGGISVGYSFHYPSGPSTIINSSVSDNHAMGGGGGVSTGGTVLLENSIVSGNSAGSHGGGIYAENLSLVSSTISGNTANGNGGGVSTSYATLVSSTISGNTVSGNGGGVSTFDATSLYSTVTGNSATGIGGGIFTYNSTIDRSILAANMAGGGNPDLRAAIGQVAATYSLIGDNAGTGFVEAQTPDANGNLIGSSAGGGVIDPRLGPLAYNGGRTQTHALLPDSPAIDRIQSPSAADEAVYVYELNGSLADDRGGTALSSLGGTLTATGYQFGSNQGLNLTSPNVDPDEYSIELFFTWNALSGGWQKIIDFHNLTVDEGLYTLGSGLQFLNEAFAANLFSPGELRHLVLTRDDSTDSVRAYVGGALAWSFIDTAGIAVLTGPEKIIRFFQDDLVSGQTEAQAGFVDRIRIFDRALNASEVGDLFNPPPPPPQLEPGDQRGFSRVYNGLSDMGSFELHPLPPPVVGDYGDAPDTSPGTGLGNYNTLSTDNGPSHVIVVGLHLGARVDADNGGLQNASANADDENGALPDDEDGFTNLAADLVLTVGAQPGVNVRVTNRTGVFATLYGWIDYNANGVFEIATERASVVVPSGTLNSIVTLTFPAVPAGFTGTTYARFRLSTDPAAANPIGAAADGEVEDYRAQITIPSGGRADSTKTVEIAHNTSGGPALADSDQFGSAFTSLGDLDGDGVTDMAVGALADDTGGLNRGAVHVLFMNANGTVKSRQKIASGVGGGPVLANSDRFGRSLAALGDLDGDGITELAVGADLDDTGGGSRGAVHVLFLNAGGTVKNSVKIASGLSGSPNLADGDLFGISVAAIGDMDGDGIPDLAVGTVSDDPGGIDAGAVHVLFLNASGTVKASQKIGHNLNGGPALAPGDRFGRSIASIGDLDGDGVTELAVGADLDSTGGADRGAVHVLFMNANGTVKASQKIAHGIGGGPNLANNDFFGRSVASIGDLDGDGHNDVVVGANFDDTGGGDRGAAYVLFLNANGTVKASQKLAHNTGGGPNLANGDGFGTAITSLGDLDGDGLVDLAIGAETDDTGGNNRGAAHVLFLKRPNTNPSITSLNAFNVAENATTVTTVTATDGDVPVQTLTFAIVSGADQAKFAITPGGALSFVSPPNFEAPTDAGGDNIYVVTVQVADDEGGTALQTISVTVTPINEHNPAFTSLDTAIVPENTTTVMTVTATDADLPAQSVTLSIVGGADQAKFALTSGGGLSFISPPNFESPTDFNGDNVYVIIVQASDGSRTNLQVILVTVTGVSEPPGDYNGNGFVDAADYTVWRDTRGALVATLSGADGSGNGIVDQADHGVWKANFGATLSLAANLAVTDLDTPDQQLDTPKQALAGHGQSMARRSILPLLVHDSPPIQSGRPLSSTSRAAQVASPSGVSAAIDQYQLHSAHLRLAELDVLDEVWESAIAERFPLDEPQDFANAALELAFAELDPLDDKLTEMSQNR